MAGKETEPTGGDGDVVALERKRPPRKRRARKIDKIDDDWRTVVREQMERHGISLSTLARLCGASKGSLWMALNATPAQPTFRYRDAVNAALRKLDQDGGPPVVVAHNRTRTRRTPVAMRVPDETTRRETQLRGMAEAWLRGLSLDELEAWLANVAGEIKRRR
jgi:hypothetical protein